MQHKKISSRLMSVLLVLTMVLSMVPVYVSADEPTYTLTFNVGNGLGNQAEDPTNSKFVITGVGGDEKVLEVAEQNKVPTPTFGAGQVFDHWAVRSPYLEIDATTTAEKVNNRPMSAVPKTSNTALTVEGQQIYFDPDVGITSAMMQKLNDLLAAKNNDEHCYSGWQYQGGNLDGQAITVGSNPTTSCTAVPAGEKDHKNAGKNVITKATEATLLMKEDGTGTLKADSEISIGGWTVTSERTGGGTNDCTQGITATYDLTCTQCKKTFEDAYTLTIEGQKHTVDVEYLEWDWSSNTVCAGITGKCSVCGNQNFVIMNNNPALVVDPGQLVSAATCTKPAQKKSVATYTIANDTTNAPWQLPDGKETIDNVHTYTDGVALGHQWKDITWVFTPDLKTNPTNPTATATVSAQCQNDSNHKIENATATTVTVKESNLGNCGQNGTVTFTATYENADYGLTGDAALKGDSEQFTIPASQNHTYVVDTTKGRDGFEWGDYNDGNPTCTVHVKCSVCQNETTVTATSVTKVTEGVKEPTCAEPGDAKFTASYGGQTSVNLYEDVVPTTPHTWTKVVDGNVVKNVTETWTLEADGNYYYTVSLTCSVCHTEAPDSPQKVKGEVSASREPTCTDKGYVTYKATVQFDEFTDGIQNHHTVWSEGIDPDAHDWLTGEKHDLPNATFDWWTDNDWSTWDYTTDGVPNCTATLRCVKCGAASKDGPVKATVTVTYKPRTCTEDGSAICSATASFSEVSKPAHGQHTEDTTTNRARYQKLGGEHEWGTVPVRIDKQEDYVYAEGTVPTCTVTFECKKCGETKTVEAEVTPSKVKEPTCVPGLANFKVETDEFVSYVAYELPVTAASQTKHAWGEPQEVNFDFENLDAFGNPTVTFKFVCQNDSTHVLTQADGSCQVKAVYDKEPDCTNEGTATYVVTFDPDDEILDWASFKPGSAAPAVKFTVDPTETLTIESEKVTVPATGHDWKEDWRWLSDTLDEATMTVPVTCTVTCQNDPTHVITGTTDDGTITITPNVTKQPTCTTAGEVVLTATLVSKEYDVTFEQSTTYPLGLVEHAWELTKINWQSDYVYAEGTLPTCTMTFTCADCAQTKTEPCEVTPGSVKAPTCGEDGVASFEAVHTASGITNYQGYPIPATGAHTWGATTEVVVTPANCTTPGLTKDVQTCEVCGATNDLGTTHEIPVTNHHNWGTPTDQSLTFDEAGNPVFHFGEIVCLDNPAHVLTKDDVQLSYQSDDSATQKPTCTQPGTGKYIVTIDPDDEILDWANYVPSSGEMPAVKFTVDPTDTIVVDCPASTIPATGHKWVEDWRWLSDTLDEATMTVPVNCTVTCENDPTHVIKGSTADGTITLTYVITKQPTCTTAGEVVLTATLASTDYGVTFTNNNTYPLIMTGHDFDNSSVKFNWQSDYVYAKDTVPTCTMTMVCSLCGTAAEPIACTVTVHSLTESNCTTQGKVVFEAVAQYNRSEYKGYSEEYLIPETEETRANHAWGTPTATFDAAHLDTEGYPTLASFEVVCANNPAHKITKFDGTWTTKCVSNGDADCTTPGTGNYVVTFTVDPAALSFPVESNVSDENGERLEFTVTSDTTTIPALGHKWKEDWRWLSDTLDEATMTVPVNCTVTCENDPTHVIKGSTADGTITITPNVTKQPTCTTAGEVVLTATLVSTDYGVTFEQNNIYPLSTTGHTWTAVNGAPSVKFNWQSDYLYAEDTVPTCTATLTCTVCGAEYTADCTVERIERTYVEPANGEDGSIQYKAAVPGDFPISGLSNTQEYTIPASLFHTHTWSEPEFVWDIDLNTLTATCTVSVECTTDHSHDIVDADCTITTVLYQAPVTCGEDGFIQFRASYKLDEENYWREDTEKLTLPGGHVPGTPVKENEVPATCTTDGSYEDVVTCTVCGTELSRTLVTVPATGHTPAPAVRENEKGASCTEAGSYDDVVYCSVCGAELSRVTRTVAALGHNYGDWYTTIEPTEYRKGEQAKVCKRCGDMITRTVDKLEPQAPDFDDFFWGSALGGLSGLRQTQYAITAKCGKGGTISPAGTTKVKYGQSITYTFTPDEGYEVSSVKVNGTEKGPITEYTFKNVRAKQTIIVAFAEAAEAAPSETTDNGPAVDAPETDAPAVEATEWVNPFEDVSDEDAFYEAVKFVAENGITTGTTETTFDPDKTITRAMFVTFLGRMEQVDVDFYADAAASYTDVEEGSYYASYVAWANEKGIVNGYGDGTFHPDDEITIEQAAVIMARYAVYCGFDTDSTIDLTLFEDVNDVDDWAVLEMLWAVETGVYECPDFQMRPLEPATRALVVTMLYNYATIYNLIND